MSTLPVPTAVGDIVILTIGIAQMDGRARERLEEIKRGGARKEKTRFSRSNVSRQNEGECAVM